MNKIVQTIMDHASPENIIRDLLPKIKGILEKKLKEQVFFAVTTTSLYKVFAMGEDRKPYAIKIGLRGESSIPIGNKIAGEMLSIAKCLQFYIPEGHSWLSCGTSFERRLEMVNTQWYQGKTSNIIALFFNEDEARKCFAFPDLVSCDPRWLEQTQEILESVGENHPTITICHWPEMDLLER